MNQVSQYQVPARITQYVGKINDIDAHENVPINLWQEEFGSVVKDFEMAIRQSELIIKAEKSKDDAPITAENVWRLKMEQAPGAFDFERRLQVMDFMGVKRQLMYPGSVGLFCMALYTRAEDPEILKSITGDRKGYARKVLNAYNDWCVRIYKKQDRLRAVAILAADDLETLVSTAKKLVNQGVRAFWMPTDRLPAGMSPAHPDLDPLWSILAAGDCAILAHVGADEGLLRTMGWRDAPAFDGWRTGNEFRFDPWTLNQLHLATQNFVATLVLGGVFERHPRLRFGSAEYTGHWIGPLAENMDRWDQHKPFPADMGTQVLKLKPSEYIRRNIRIACFDFEPVGKYIDNFGLEDVYCYASDFPHHEGGKRPMEDFTESLKGQSEEIVRKFFIDNGELLLPD